MTTPFSRPFKRRPSFPIDVAGPWLEAGFSLPQSETAGQEARRSSFRGGETRIETCSAPVAVELGAVGFQPLARTVDRARKILAELPEARPVVHLFQMRDLVR